MADNLVIVESPTKAGTIGKFLGKNYKVESSVGHIRDLPKSTFGVDIENDFEPKYMTIRGKADVVNTLKKQAKAAKKVYLATDPDREGEAISWHLAYILGLDPTSVCRVTFNEITEKTVKASIKNPHPINMNIVNAQQARRILDRIVGYKISPLLWKNVRKGLSAGRVQSVATRIICDREEEIEKFVPKEYWNLTVKLAKQGKEDSFPAKFHGSLDGKKIEILNEEQSNSILNAVKDAQYSVKDIKNSKKSKNPMPPFTTSTLQQEASRKLGFQTRKTMMIAQQLYEGIDIKGKGTTGLVTYIRTDSVRLSEEAVEEIRNLIGSRYGKEYLPENSRVYKNKNSSQNAHEAIRPSYPELMPEEIKASLTNDQYKLYKLIWDRFTSSQMSNAQIDVLSVDISAGDYIFRATGSKVDFPGFMKVYLEGKDETEENDEENTRIPPLEIGEKLIKKNLESKQMFTQPPSRYTEATLVKALEEKGIGRPSTYAPTISTIIQRGYIEREKKILHPTELGKIINDLMKKNFEDIVDIKFTAVMETDLDNIEEGKEKWKDVISKFYTDFSETLKTAEENIGKVVIEDEVSDVVCDKCGKMMVVKNGRYGKFLACPGFPECRNVKSIIEEAGVDCPKCGKPLIKRKTKKMKPYMACSGYPDCNYVNWDMPVKDAKCEKCGSFMVKHYLRGGKSYNKCGNPVCETNSETESVSEEKK